MPEAGQDSWLTWWFRLVARDQNWRNSAEFDMYIQVPPARDQQKERLYLAPKNVFFFFFSRATSDTLDVGYYVARLALLMSTGA
jgi:hypothetical protein